MLTGEAKKRYQREYMRSYMRKRRAVLKTEVPRVRTDPGSRVLASPADSIKTHVKTSDVKTQEYAVQHTNPMMKGYVPLPR